MIVQKALVRAEPRSVQGAERLYRRGAVEDKCSIGFQEIMSRANLEVCHGAGASQAGVGRKTEFSGMGLLGMWVGVQPIRAALWHIHGRDDGALRTAARQGVQVPCLCGAPEISKKSTLAKAFAGYAWHASPGLPGYRLLSDVCVLYVT